MDHLKEAANAASAFPHIELKLHRLGVRIEGRAGTLTFNQIVAWEIIESAVTNPILIAMERVTGMVAPARVSAPEKGAV